MVYYNLFIVNGKIRFLVNINLVCYVEKWVKVCGDKLVYWFLDFFIE